MIHEHEYLRELDRNLASGDELKAKLVAQHLDGQSPELQSEILRTLENFAGDIAVPVLGVMLDIPIGSLEISRSDIAAVVAEKAMVKPSALAGLTDDAKIQVATRLGELGDVRGLKPLRFLILERPESANLRFTVYEALGRLPMHAGAYMLAAGLEDKDAAVRIAAARAIDRNLSDTLHRGVLNMLDSADPTPANIVAAIAQAGAMNTIEAMLVDDRFARLFGGYIEQGPDPEFLRSTRPLLQKCERHALVSLVDAFLASLKESQGPTIYAVDDSNTVLRMYRAALGRVAAVLKTFENPFEALEWAEKEPPDILFTDLNMPGIDGIELATRLRGTPAMAEVPIVMVSTETIDDSQRRALAAGVNRFVLKPFRAAELAEVINALTDYEL